MKITEFSVKNYQFTIIIFLMALAIGVSSLLNMPRGEDPVFNVSVSTIVAVYPGASPKDMEKLVADPIEEKVKELNDVKKVTSSIDDGLCVTSVEFNYGTNPDDKYNEVVRELNAIRPQLPADLLSLDITKFSASDASTYQSAIVSQSASYKEIYDEADILKKSLEKIPEIKKVKINGYPEQQIRISIDLPKMALNKIPLGRTIGIIQAGAVNIPGGSVDAGGKKFNIKTTGDYSSLNDIKNLPIVSADNKIVYLKDIAAVTMQDEDQTYIARYNGKRAVFISASEKEKTNILQVNQKVEPVLAEFSKSLPTNMKFEKGFVQARDVDKRLSHFARDFAIAILLVMITLMPLGWRASTVVMISIPLSISIGLFLLNIFGYTINQLSIVGLVIALGLLVDDSIVVVENIERFLREGYSRFDAAIKATSQISKAVMGATATLILAFLPLIFLPGSSGDFIRSLPMSVSATVLASFFVSVTVVPFLASMILSRHENPEGNFSLRYLKKIINATYRPILNKAVTNPYTTLVIAFGLFAGSLFLFKVIGFSLFPESEKPMFLVNIETPLGTNLDKTDTVAHNVESELHKIKEMDSYFTNVGKGNPRIYYNVSQKNEAANYAQIFVRLKDMDVPELNNIIDQLRAKFNYYPNAKIEVKRFEQGPPIDAPIALRIFGENLDSLRSIARKIESLMKSTEGTIYVNNPLSAYKTDIKLNINKDKAAMLGVPTNEIDRTVRMGIAGINAAIYRDDKGDKYQINVTLKHDKHQTLDVFNNLYVTSQTGTLIPINQLASMEFETSIPTIKHYNNNRYVILTSYVKNGYNTNEVTKKILSKVDNNPFPKGYSYAAAGEVESSADSFGGLGTIITITIFGFMGVLLLEFKTFKSALIVLSVIPLGVIGAVVMLLLTGNTLSFTAVVGFIALAGIEVKNTILLVDYTNYLREKGMALDQAIEEAGETRFLPIILTTATAIGGLIPLIIEQSPLYSPLALALVGGLITSTILTRFVTPVIYKLLPPHIEAAE
jgi:multidrug efflux pump subunit AcrB